MKPCFCGKMPELVKGMRDRGIHPEEPWLRYSCSKNLDGHILMAPTARAKYLGWSHNTPELIQMAEDNWNKFLP